jgi:CDP-paratose synthetase
MKEKILITGGTGFLGSALVHFFCERGYHVGITVRGSSNISKIIKLKDKVEFFNITNHTVKEILETFIPKIVIHTAVCYGNKETGKEVFETNLKFFIDLLDASIKVGVNNFLNTDTFSGKNKKYNYLKEYHLSKRHALEWSRVLLKDSDLLFSNMRLEHLYGTRDNPNKFVPFIVNSMMSDVSNLPLTAGVQERDFVYTTDVAEAYLAVIENQTSKFEEYEVGTGKSTSIKEFVLTVKNLASNNSTRLDFGALPTRKGEYKFSVANIEKLTKFGWKPEVSLEVGIENIIAEKSNSN